MQNEIESPKNLRHFNTIKNLLYSIANDLMFDIVQHAYSKQNPKKSGTTQNQTKKIEQRKITMKSN